MITINRKKIPKPITNPKEIYGILKGNDKNSRAEENGRTNE